MTTGWGFLQNKKLQKGIYKIMKRNHLEER